MKEGYKVGEDGTVIGLRGRALSPWKSKDGYWLVQLSLESGERKHHLVHRLVAEKFIPNPLGLPQVNHKDGDKSNNHVSNLEWCTQSFNMKHSFDAGLRKGGITPTNAKLTLEDAKEMRRLRKEHKHTYYVLGDMFGVTYQAAHSICTYKYFKDGA